MFGYRYKAPVAAISVQGSIYMLNSCIKYTDNNAAIYFIDNNENRYLRYNDFKASVTNSPTTKTVVDARYNYWNSTNGPQIRNGSQYIGNGSLVGNNINYAPYNSEVVWSDEELDDIFEKIKLDERVHYGQEGVGDVTGNFSETEDDLNIEIPNIDLKFTRTYNSRDNNNEELGKGWNFGFKAKVEKDNIDNNIVYVYIPNGNVNIFKKNNIGVYEGINTRNNLIEDNNIYTLISTNQTKYVFSFNNKLSKIIDKYGNEISIIMNESNRITKIIDFAGREYNLTYSNEKLTQIEDPIGRKVYYEYNDKGLLVKANKVNGQAIFYEYNDNNVLSKVKKEIENGEIVDTKELTYYYNQISGSKIKTVKDANGKIDTYTYETMSSGAYQRPTGITTITDNNGRITKRYTDKFGYLVKEITPNGLETVITYNLYNNENRYGEIKSKKEITGKTTSYEYDLIGNITKQINSDGSYKSYIYNSKNNVIKQIDEENNIVEYEYYNEIKLKTKKTEDGALVTFEYYDTDIKGLCKSKIDGNGNKTSYEYDIYGNLIKTTNALNNSEINSVNKIGWILSKTSAENIVTMYEYDTNGNKVKEKIGEVVKEQNFYDYDNRLIKVINANGDEKNYEYDIAGNLLKETNEEENSINYEYDSYSNIVKKTDLNSTIYEYEYDNINRKIKESVWLDNIKTTLETYSYSYNSGNTIVTTNKYKNNEEYTVLIKETNYLDKIIKEKIDERVKTCSYYLNGLLKYDENEIGKRNYYEYNEVNNLVKKYEEIDNDLYKLTYYTYDLNENIIEEKTSKEKVGKDAEYTNEIVTTYGYDEINSLAFIATSSGEEKLYSYDKDNRRIVEKVKIEDNKFKVISFEYNSQGSISKQKEKIVKSSIVNNNLNDNELIDLVTTYSYDNMKNLIKEIMPDGKVINYSYNKLSQVIKKEQVKAEANIIESKEYNASSQVIKYVDGNGNSIRYEYDRLGNKIKEIVSDDKEITYEYDLTGNIIKEIAPKFKEDTRNNITYTYDNYNNVIKKTINYSDGDVLKQSVTLYEYDNINNLVKETSGDRILKYEYNKASKLIKETDGNGGIVKYEYDANLNIVKEINKKGIVTNYSYDDRNNQTKIEINSVIKEQKLYNLINKEISVTDSIGKKVTSKYDINGNLVSENVENNGYEIRYQYDLNRNLARIVDNLNKEIVYKYDILGNKIEETTKKQDSHEGITLKRVYDKVNNLVKETDGNSNETLYEYDLYNNKIKETNALGQVKLFTYDKNNNLIKETDYLGNSKTNIYDNLDRIIEKQDEYSNVIEKLVYDNLDRQIESIDVSNDKICYTYDNNDNILTKKDEEGFVESFEYDAEDNKVKYIDKKGNITKYDYDYNNNLVKVTNALNEITEYTYDNIGNVIEQKDNEGNSIFYEYDNLGNELKKKDRLNREEIYTYYINGLLKSYTTRNGDTFNYEYDIYNRRIEETVGDETINITYDNNDNKLTEGNIVRTYDALNRILTENNNGNLVSYVYNDSSNKITITDSKGNVKEEEYDKASRLKKVIDGEDITEYEYNKNGSVKKQINENQEIEYKYNKDKTLGVLTTKDKNGNVIEEYSYKYDENNNIIKENEEEYSYDELDRLKTVDNKEYEYDTRGNITKKRKVISLEDGTSFLSEEQYVYDLNDRLLRIEQRENAIKIGETSYTYDDNGNQITEITENKVITNSYNKRNELIKREEGNNVEEYIYDEEGKRIEKTGVNNIKYIYDGTRVILELDENDNEKARNKYGLALIKRTVGEEKGYYTYNGHGDVTKLIGDNNEVKNSYKYDEYGKVGEESETIENPYRYAGYMYDKESKNYYLQSRYYSPEQRRFITEDTVRGNREDPLSLNLYTYTKNNPKRYIDPDGHIALPVPIITGIIGGITNTAINFIGDIIEDGKINRDWKTYVGAFVEGGIIGGGFGLLGKGAGIIKTIGAGIGLGFVGDATDSLITTGKIDVEQSFVTGITTGISAGVFSLGGSIKGKGIERILEYGLRGFNASAIGNSINQILTKDIKEYDPFEAIKSGAAGMVIAPVVGTITEKAIDKWGTVNVKNKNLIKCKDNDFKYISENMTPDELADILNKLGWKKSIESGGNKSGEATIFTNQSTEIKIRIMANPANGKPYFRVQNANGNYLDAKGVFPSKANKSNFRDLTHFNFRK